VWKELISEADKAATFSHPASKRAIEAGTSALSQQLPKDLISLLSETDGVSGEYGTRLIWDLEEIVTRNMDYRLNPEYVGTYMPFEPLLFFADAGSDGILFAFLSDPIVSANIFVWYPIEDTRSWFAKNLDTWIHGWIGGTLHV
jgi:SMI1-KNR4 cell-wall